MNTIKIVGDVALAEVEMVGGPADGRRVLAPIGAPFVVVTRASRKPESNESSFVTFDMRGFFFGSGTVEGDEWKNAEAAARPRMEDDARLSLYVAQPRKDEPYAKYTASYVGDVPTDNTNRG